LTNHSKNGRNIKVERMPYKMPMLNQLVDSAVVEHVPVLSLSVRYTNVELDYLEHEPVWEDRDVA
jgi:hypothetical protein